jgi:hypothetical protein
VEEMNPKDWLDLLIRISGLAFLLFATFDVFYILAKIFGIPTGSNLSVSADIFAGLFFMILGLGILSCAKLIVRLAYWR